MNPVMMMIIISTNWKHIKRERAIIIICKGTCQPLFCAHMMTFEWIFAFFLWKIMVNKGCTFVYTKNCVAIEKKLNPFNNLKVLFVLWCYEEGCWVKFFNVLKENKNCFLNYWRWEVFKNNGNKSLWKQTFKIGLKWFSLWRGPCDGKIKGEMFDWSQENQTKKSFEIPVIRSVCFWFVL